MNPAQRPLPGRSSRALLALLAAPLLAACAGERAVQDLGPAARDLGASEPADARLPGDASLRPDLASAPDGGLPGGDLFDLPAIRDPATASCTFAARRTTLEGTTLIEVWDVSYISWELRGGQLAPITIRGFAARPAGQTGLPGLVHAHGLGGFAKENDAVNLAALTGMFAIAYTGPGGGNAPNNTSEGLPSGHDKGRRMFDTLPDVRGSWFWAHAVAGLRGLTCLAAHSDVDSTRLGMTGYSAGAVATLLAAGADDRIRAAVPLSGSVAWEVAVESPLAWQNNLLAQAGLTPQSPEWQALIDQLITPAAVVGMTRAKVLLADGTTDEFFPLTALNATQAAIPSLDTRLSLIGNFDHGCYKISGLESASTIEARATLRADGAQRFWFKYWFATDPRYRYLPGRPTVSAVVAGPLTSVTARVDALGPEYLIEEVRFWWSIDNAYTFANLPLDDIGNGLYDKTVPAVLPPGAVYYVDVQYRVRTSLAERFSLSSVPVIPAGMVPRIRNIGNCL